MQIQVINFSDIILTEHCNACGRHFWFQTGWSPQLKNRLIIYYFIHLINIIINSMWGLSCWSKLRYVQSVKYCCQLRLWWRANTTSFKERWIGAYSIGLTTLFYIGNNICKIVHHYKTSQTFHSLFYFN